MESNKKYENKAAEIRDRFDAKPYQNLVITAAAVLLVSFLIIMINQAAQLVQLAAMMDPVFGKLVLAVFALLALSAAVVTVLLIAGLEKPLSIPDEGDTEAYTRYLSKLKKRLMKNKYLKRSGHVWESGAEDADAINEALLLLDAESRRIVKRNGAAVFVTTAVSQNGSLDGIFVFVTVIKLVWRISLLYNQRPAIRDLVKLYSNVFGTVLLTRQIDDLDLVAEQLEPVLSTLFGGVVGNMLPGVGYVVSFVVDSVLEGSLNTLLTLRVGIITQNYCRSVTRIEPRRIGKTATYQACEMLGNIVGDNSKRISEALLKAIRNSAADSIGQGRNKITGIFERIFGKDGYTTE